MKVCPVRYGGKDENGDLYGALVLPNRDVDTGDYLERGNKVDSEDTVINGAADLVDLAPLHLQRVLLAEADMPADLQCHVKLVPPPDDSCPIPIAERARVWNRIATDATVLVGGPGGSTTFVYDRADPADAAFFARIAGSGDPLVLDVEGLYPGAPFAVRVEFHQPSGSEPGMMAQAYEYVNMLCSPFILANNTCAVEHLHLSAYYTDEDWVRFREGFAPALDAGQIEEVPSRDHNNNKYYVQDCAEPGAVALTDGSGVITQAMRFFGLIEHRLSLESRIGPDVGGAWLGIGARKIGNAPRWEMGGNIECLPPFGEFEHGLLLTDSHLKDTDVFMSFMKTQAVQVGPRGHCLAPVIDAMGYAHIDEFACVYADGDGWGIMVADFELGLSLLDANRGVATDGPNQNVLSTEQLVADYIDIEDALRHRREERDSKIEGNAKAIEVIESICMEHGIPMVRVPVLLHFADAPHVHGGLPNSVNGLIMGDVRHMPNPWFPPFRQAVEDGVMEGTWQWEDTIGFWRGGGQLHCGTNAERGLEAMVVP